MIRTIPISLAAAALCLMALAQPAAAQSAAPAAPRVREGFSSDPSQIVRKAGIDLSDLDLSSSTGVQTLFGRIQRAADAACGGPGSFYSKSTQEDYSACRDAAISGAVARMRLPALATLASRTHDAALAAK